MYKKTGQVKKTKTKDITPETPQVGIKPFVETEYNKEFKILNKKYNNELKKVSKIDRDKTISELNKKYFPLVQELKIKYGINPEPALKDYYAKGNEDEPIIENSNVIEDTKINLGKINVNQEKIIEEKRLAEEKLKEELEKKRKIQEQLDAINAKLEKIKKEKEKEEGIKKIKDDIESKLK